MNLIQHKVVRLRDVGKDERWLQTEIGDNPSMLGLGDDLKLFRKELKQSGGGRVDMVLVEREADSMYEVEIMLGATDPSHIIRTLEYWDIESRRYPGYEHHAVVVAEEITNRFFNVIWLLSRSIPIIAVQLSVLTVGENFLLHFTKVLDTYERPGDLEEQSAPEADLPFWEKRSSAEAMAISIASWLCWLKVMSSPGFPTGKTVLRWPAGTILPMSFQENEETACCRATAGSRKMPSLKAAPILNLREFRFATFEAVASPSSSMQRLWSALQPHSPTLFGEP